MTIALYVILSVPAVLGFLFIQNRDLHKNENPFVDIQGGGDQTNSFAEQYYDKSA